MGRIRPGGSSRRLRFALGVLASVPAPELPSLPTTGLVSRLIAGTGLTVDGFNKVSAWADQSGAGNGAAQATAINQPTAGTDSAGRPIVQFLVEQTTANSDTMTVASGVTFNAQAVSVFIAARIHYGVNSNPFGLSNYAGTNAHLRFVSGSANTAPQTLYANSRNSGLAADMHPTVLSVVSGATVVLGMGPDLISGLASVTADTDCLGAQIGAYNGAGFQSMDVYEVLVYNAALSTQDAAAARAYLAAKYATRTAPWTKSIVFEGDSITQGTGPIQLRGYPSMVLRSSTDDWRQTNIGASGLNLASMTARAAATDGYKRANTRNVLMVQIGRNDAAVGGATGQAMYNSLVTYVQARVAAGWEVWVGTAIASNGTLQPILDDYNTRIRAGIVAAGANRVVDFAALPQFDATADASNTTYYQGDQTHPNAAGAQLLADLVAVQLAA